jgi:copper chaperone
MLGAYQEISMTVEFLVPDISCEHCVKTVTAAVKGIAPAAQVKIDLVSHHVSIEGADAAKAKAAIEEAGYDVQAA